MRVTILVDDKTVYVDNEVHHNLTWQGTPENVRVLQWQGNSGWLEFKDTTINEDITELPQWASNAVDAFEVANIPVPFVPTKEYNKAVAMSALYDTDWSTIPDVSDPTKSNPYLTNVAEYVTFRNEMRQIVIDPQDGEISFPSKPKAVWST